MPTHDDAQKPFDKQWLFVIVGALAGIYLGFRIGGVGGAIVFAILGAILGLFLPDLLALVAIGGAMILAVVLGITVIVLAIRLISSLWGVGRP